MAEMPAYAKSLFERDPDRAYAALFAPESARHALLALYAFHHEIAKVREVVSEPMLGAIRLQWWREALDGLERGVTPRHELGAPLGEAMTRHGVAGAALHRMIDAREVDFDEVPFETESDLEVYVRDSAGVLVDTGARLLCHGEGKGSAWSDEMTSCAHHAGLAWGLTGLLRALPFHARQRRCLLPRTLLSHRQIDPSQIFAGQTSPGLIGGFEDIVSLARTHLATARRDMGAVPRTALPAFLYVTLTDQYLKKLSRPDHNPFTVDVTIPTYAKLWRLYWRAQVGRI